MNTKVLNVAICGAPNSGKSTFLNTVLNEKVSIVSPKAQTTRNTIRGIINKGDTQIIFTDTPGIFRARKDFTLETRISRAAWKVVRASSTVILMIDGSTGISPQTMDILADFKRREKSLIAVINKIDKVSEKKRLDLGIELEKEGDVVEAIFYISSLNAIGIEKLLSFLTSKALRGEWFFNDDVITDTTEKMTVAELFREQIFLNMQEEIPYHSFIETESFEEYETEIRASILVMVTKESQKIIIIGKRGKMLSILKKAAENELEKIFQKTVHLEVFIKVRKDWREREEPYEILGI